MARSLPAPQIEESRAPNAELALWRVYDAGAAELLLKIRYRDDEELPNWREGPDLATALAQAKSDGWHAYDREPGAAPGEYAILHMVRIHTPG